MEKIYTACACTTGDLELKAACEMAFLKAALLRKRSSALSYLNSWLDWLSNVRSS